MMMLFKFEIWYACIRLIVSSLYSHIESNKKLVLLNNNVYISGTQRYLLLGIYAVRHITGRNLLDKYLKTFIPSNHYRNCDTTNFGKWINNHDCIFLQIEPNVAIYKNCFCFSYDCPLNLALLHQFPAYFSSFLALKNKYFWRVYWDQFSLLTP